jgi:hypothetical protein
MVIGKVGVVDALGGVVEADTFLSLRKRGSPPAQYWQKYDGEHAKLEQLTAEELDIFLGVQVRSSTHIMWVLQGPAPGTAKLNELQTEIWQQSGRYIVQRAAVAAGAEAQAPVQWNSAEMARPDLSRSDITGWPRELWDDGREKQHNNQCLKHAINNLYQLELLTVEYMNYISVNQPIPGNVNRDWSDHLLEESFGRKALKIYQPSSDLTTKMLNRVEYPAHRWYEHVRRDGTRDSRMDPYGFILQDLQGEGHFYAIRVVDPVTGALGGGTTHWEILNSQGSVKPALMENDQLDEYLCKRMHTRDYRIYSLPRAREHGGEQGNGGSKTSAASMATRWRARQRRRARQHGGEQDNGGEHGNTAVSKTTVVSKTLAASNMAASKTTAASAATRRRATRTAWHFSLFGSTSGQFFRSTSSTR